MRRALWFLVTVSAVVGLLSSIRPTTRPLEEPGLEIANGGGFDQPDAAAWHELQRRMPPGGGDVPALY